MLVLLCLTMLAISAGKFFQSDSWEDGAYVLMMVFFTGSNLADLIVHIKTK